MAAALLAAACQSPTAPLEANVGRVTIDPVALTLRVGDTVTVRAQPATADGRPVDVAVRWSSELDTVAVVRAHGARAMVEARRPGTTQIRAEAGGRLGQAVITVVPRTQAVPVHRIELTPSWGTLATGGETTVRARPLAADGTPLARPVTWSSTDTTVLVVVEASAETATVRARGPGWASLEARSEAVTARAQLEVRAAVPVARVLLTPPKRGVWESQYADFQVHALASNGTELAGRSVRLWPEDPSVAEVDAAGRVRGIAKGMTLIVAESEGVRGFAELHVYERASQMSFELTYDWWDGQLRLMHAVADTTWTDPAGVERPVVLYATRGVFSVDLTAGRWSREIVAEGHATVDGVMRTVATRVDVGGGALAYRWNQDGSYSFDFIEDAAPQPVFRGVFRSGGELLVGLPVLGGQADYLFRIAG